MYLQKSKISFFVVRIGVLTVSITFICVGLMKREHIEVFRKAVRICLECIGIG